jgi:hypothetical protein
MNRLVRFSGRKASGSLVVSSTVRLSILRALRSVGMRLAVTPTWLASKCTASLSSTLRTFHTTESAFSSLPSWNFTPGRSLNTHLVLSLASTAQLVARPGISTLAASALLRSQCVSASYIGMPVKRLPSKPWSGWPSVRGMSAAVIAMRSTFSCASAAGADNRAARLRAAQGNRRGSSGRVMVWKSPWMGGGWACKPRATLPAGRRARCRSRAPVPAVPAVQPGRPVRRHR